MKKFILLVVITIIATAANAQTQSGVNSDYNQISLSFMSTTLNVDGYSTQASEGAAMEYKHGFSISSTIPLYVEAGAQLSFFPGKVDDDVLDGKLNLFRINVPVSVAYKFTLPKNNSFWIKPYAGLDFIGNCMYKEDAWHWDKDYTKAIQGGWHIGVNVGYQSINLGVKYARDFTDLYSKNFEKGYDLIDYAFGVQTSNFLVSIGYDF